MKTYSQVRTTQMVRLALFFALITIQTWVPFLGNINIPPLSITFVHVTVIVAVLWLGTKEGVIVGAVWGLNSWVRSLVMPVSPLHALVLSSPIISVLPRILMPLIIGYVYRHMMNGKTGENHWRLSFLGGLGSLLNTGLLLGFIGLFKTSAGMSVMGATSSQALWYILMGIVLTNGIPEAIFSSIMTPILVRALSVSQGKRKYRKNIS